ncbi:flagellar filament capping protein FliD [Spirillospora albida]|uniref:flagellar filament capping protein FliD n=1 Tax=Spirillospora albida TaxID=58123 RepID=UPI0004C20A43|nr:flagellar filament capping protein FliD [Spirillospora albida]
MTSSIDGLVSGLSTSGLISQLMQVESAPQTALRTKVTAQEKIKTAYQTLNSKVAGLKTAAEAMNAESNWGAAKATSTSTSVTATATSGAPAANVTFDVLNLARAQVRTTAFGSATDPALAAGVSAISLRIGTADPVDIAVTVNTPQGVADAINAKGLDVRAAVLTTDQGTVLQLTSTKTGTAAAFDIPGLARATASYASAAAPALADGATGVGIQVGGGAVVDVAVTDNTPQGVADAINAAGIAGVTAKVATVDGQSVLTVTHSKDGAPETLAVTGLASPTTATRTGLTGATTVAVTAQDAKIQVGALASGGYTVTSGTNSFSNLMQGVTIGVSKVESGVSVAVAGDTAAIADKMKTLVDAANSLLSEITAKTVYDAASKAKGALSGNFGVRQIAQTVLSGVATGQTGYGSFSQFGVELDRTGKLTFDREAFLEAYAADPAKVKAAVSATDPAMEGLVDADGAAVEKTKATPLMGLAEKLLVMGNFANQSITTAIQNGDSRIKDLNKQIDGWDVRLELRRAALQKQFAGLEVALGKLQQQSSWLSGQLANLPTTSSK